VGVARGSEDIARCSSSWFGSVVKRGGTADCLRQDWGPTAPSAHLTSYLTPPGSKFMLGVSLKYHHHVLKDRAAEPFGSRRYDGRTAPLLPAEDQHPGRFIHLPLDGDLARPVR
jgi:hypothetical protein